MLEKKEAVIAEVIFHNEANGYTVAVCESVDEQFTAVGFLPSSSKGRTYALSGKWDKHPIYGEQFSFSSYEEVMPQSNEGIESFLASGILKGIGKKTASAIVARFGKDTFDIIRNEPERLTEIGGIGPAKARTISESFQSHRELAEITLYFRNYDINAESVIKLYKRYGSDTVALIEENPYRVIKDVHGIGFKKADAMALKIGIAKDDPHRIKSAIDFVLRWYASEGNTYVPQKELCEKAGELLDVSSEDVEDRLVEMVFEGDVQIKNAEGRPAVYLMQYFLAEQYTAGKLAELNDFPVRRIRADVDALIKQTESRKGIKLSDNQQLAVTSILAYGVSIVTGGPGTGKTTILNTLIDIFEYEGLKTAVAAPTGRAAKRITETSGYGAVTIHRLLEYSYSEDDDAMLFGRTEENPLEYDAIIVDEASMIDLLLMRGLLAAIKPGTRLIIVGDADQLPSVGAGNVLRNMIESERIYCIKLTEIFRQAQESLIIVNSHRINKGEYPDYNERDGDFFLVRKNGEKEILAAIKDLYIRRLPGYYTDCEPMRDIQILTPVRKGMLGSLNLNAELQGLLNPARPGVCERKFGDKIFREGDKVMQMRNNYNMKWKRASNLAEGEGIFNGDVGFIHTVDNENGRIVVVFDDDKFASYDATNFDELELAYAMTVHKSQGSEFPIVVMPVSWFPPILAVRNLLYTAVTRGKRLVVMVGSEDRLQDMVDNNSTRMRYSGLAENLRNAMGNMQ